MGDHDRPTSTSHADGQTDGRTDGRTTCMAIPRSE